MNDYDQRREKLRDPKPTQHGKTIFLTGSNALETIDDALGALVVRERQLARSEGFEACTAYWKNVVMKIMQSTNVPFTVVCNIASAMNITDEDIAKFNGDPQ